MALPMGALAQSSGADPARLAQEILSEGGYQTQLPAQAHDGPPVTPPLALLELVFWVGVAVLAALLAWWLVRLVRDYRGRGARAQEPSGVARAFVASDPRLEEAEAQAQRGEFGEAIHLLLLVAIARLGRELDQPPEPSATSRELLRAFRLRGAAREDLRFLVGRVEVFLFGGAPLGREDYAESRARLDALLAERPA
ncbi:MAG: DUF4129 domain-containing protein [Planctomycetes bacterium]|nr:DUF4129 domain-containing protein [Planctomycetota bacterium]